MKALYAPRAERYRMDDEVDINLNHHQRIAQKLEHLTSSFGRPITVLDVGCGTGRYFYCLENVEKLVGLDLSQEMLNLARDPLKAEKLSIKEMELRCDNVYTTEFPPESFDLIYSFGVFGNGCAVTPELCGQFYNWLKPNGKIFFDAFDIFGVPFRRKIQILTRNFIYRLLPESLQDKWDQKSKWLPFFLVSKRQLNRLMEKNQFFEVTIDSHLCQLTKGPGYKLECLAVKGAS